MVSASLHRAGSNWVDDVGYVIPHALRPRPAQFVPVSCPNPAVFDKAFFAQAARDESPPHDPDGGETMPVSGGGAAPERSPSPPPAAVDAIVLEDIDGDALREFVRTVREASANPDSQDSMSELRPNEHLCPIGHHVMENPVVLSCGCCFDAELIRQSLELDFRCPSCRQVPIKFPTQSFTIPNGPLKSLIDNFKPPEPE